MNIEKAIAREQKRIDYVNKYNKENYDRVSVLLPKGTKERVAQTGETMNSFLKRIVLDELDRLGV